MSNPSNSNSSRTITLTLESGPYAMADEEDGSVSIAMEGFGTEVAPGRPQLPGRTIHVELPQGAVVQNVAVAASETTQLDGSFRITPARAVVQDRPLPPRERAELVEAAQREWELNSEAAYGSDDPYPAEVVSFLGHWQGRKHSYARLRFCPLQYRPRSGRLTLHGTVRAAISYTLQSRDPERVGRFRAAGSFFVPDVGRIARQPLRLDDSTDLHGTYNYVILVPDAATARAVAGFKSWKERIGHSVAVVQVGHIYRSYGGVDNAERIRAFLVDKHEEWGIHYVLLAGDMNVVPTRILYPADTPPPYAADFYFADLGTVQWDGDGDQRWGEFGDDHFNWLHDVVVGRLPFNGPAEIERVCHNIVAFEQDTGVWKHVELFAHGFMDLCPTDGAELSERIIADFLTPAGWKSRKLYEQGGTAPTKYAADLPLTQANYEAECGPQRQGLVCLTAHGGPDGMQSLFCTEPSGNCNCSTKQQLGRNDFGDGQRITGNFLSAVVVMNGCSTAAPVPNYDAVETGGRSLFQIGPVQDHNGRRYLEAGAVAVVGSSAGSDYAHNWQKPAHGKSQSLTYYFHEHLIKHRKSVGDAFFDAAVDQATKHGLARGLRVFYLMGDPSLNILGVADRPGGQDALIHQGRFSYFAGANDDNGDMYVVVAIGAAAEPAKFRIYRSTDHGHSWPLWQSFEISESVAHVEALVNRYGSGEMQDNRLLVFFTTYEGSLRCYRFPLTEGLPHQSSIAGPAGGLFAYFSVAKEVAGASGRLFLAYTVRPAVGPDRTLVGRSMNNGVSWGDWSRFEKYVYPSVDVGPRDYVYLAALYEGANNDPVHVVRSTDGGVHWGSWIDLTAGDGALDHCRTDTPVVSATTHPSYPVVWVAYSRSFPRTGGRLDHDLGYAYSGDGGSTWTRNLTLSAASGVQEYPHLLGYKAAPNPWMNVAYISGLLPSSGVGLKQTRILWQAVSGGEASAWSAVRIVNDFDAREDRPQLIFSPGAPGTGSGVVYGGVPDKIYFSAPWL